LVFGSRKIVVTMKNLRKIHGDRLDDLKQLSLVKFLPNFMDFELNLGFPFKFEIQKGWPLRDIVPTIANMQLYQTGLGVFQTELKVFLFNPVGMHTPSPKT
jgi:hypothetical protein